MSQRLTQNRARSRAATGHVPRGARREVSATSFVLPPSADARSAARAGAHLRLRRGDDLVDPPRRRTGTARATARIGGLSAEVAGALGAQLERARLALMPWRSRSHERSAWTSTVSRCCATAASRCASAASRSLSVIARLRASMSAAERPEPRVAREALVLGDVLARLDVVLAAPQLATVRFARR